MSMMDELQIGAGTLRGEMTKEESFTKIWEYVEPNQNGDPITIRMTEAEILDYYFPYWFSRMREKFRWSGLTNRNLLADCIGDWVISTGAQPASDKTSDKVPTDPQEPPPIPTPSLPLSEKKQPHPAPAKLNAANYAAPGKAPVKRGPYLSPERMRPDEISSRFFEEW